MTGRLLEVLGLAARRGLVVLRGSGPVAGRPAGAGSAFLMAGPLVERLVGGRLVVPLLPVYSVPGSVVPPGSWSVAVVGSGVLVVGRVALAVLWGGRVGVVGRRLVPPARLLRYL